MPVVVLALLIVAGCGRGSAPEASTAAPTIVLPGDASGAWWDGKTKSLFVTDDTNHAILRWTGGAFQRVAEVPDARGLGGLIGLPDGRLVVTAFGGGTDGAVFVVADGKASRVPGLDPARRRTGIALAPDGALYVTFFTKPSGEPARGGVAQLALEKGETDLITDLAKPVGVTAGPLAVFVTDQQRNQLVSFARKDPSHSEAVVARDLAEPDLIEALPGGDLVVGSKTGVLYRITPAGGPSVIARGLGAIRGVAYDPVSKRLHVVEHGGAAKPSVLHLVAVE